jgi:hypothetical protein
MIRKYLAYCIFLLLFLSSVSALAIMGRDAKFGINVVPGYTSEETFTITNNEGYTSTYDIIAVPMAGTDMTKYFNITPSRIENVGTGEATSTKVRVFIPENVDVPGVSEVWVKVQIDTTRGGGITATPSVAIRYIFSVLYPSTYVSWGILISNLNVNETKKFGVSVQNIGIPTIKSTYADVTIKNKETNESYWNFRTETAADIVSWSSRTLNGEFNSAGLLPGDYVANFTLHYDDNISVKEGIFRIGSKNVYLQNFTRLFEKESINKMDIIIESAWNKQINEIYADVYIYDIETGKELKRFKSLNTGLLPWEIKTLEAYFDTHGLEKKDYRAVAYLKYEGETAVKEGTITIGENINAVIVDEIPGTFSFSALKSSFAAAIKGINYYMVLIFLFIVSFGVLIAVYIKKRDDEEDIIDENVVNYIKDLRKTYSDDYIRDMMIKKGWSSDRASKVFIAVKKK